MFYSWKNGGFYSHRTHESDKEISFLEYNFLLSEEAKGRKIVADVDGAPIAIDKPATPREEILDRAKNELRAMRAPMLDALTGIAGRAVRAGNDALASEADSLAEQLLDITDDPALNAATTYEAMQSAGVDAYRAIAATASPALASVFKEITGA
jgi:hypothetical protein